MNIESYTQRMISEMADNMMNNFLFGSTSCSAYTGPSQSSLTLDDINEAKRIIDEMTVPAKITIYPSPFMTVHKDFQWFVPRSKKKRIVKKCKKLYTEHREEPDMEHVYHITSMKCIACHPAMKNIIESALLTGKAMYKVEE